MKNIMFQILLISLFILAESINWLALLLDELFFPSYKKIEIKSPLYISGMPRTATSLMHNLLSGDHERFTTMKLWEIAFAPSIIQKKILIFVNKVDLKLGHPFRRYVQNFEKKLFKRFDITHPLSLANVEEDEYLMIHNFSSGLVIFFFPSISQKLFSRGSLELYSNKTNKVQFYKNCIKKHLFVFGKDRIYLAKSPAHLLRYSLLIKNFPDLKMVNMVRAPHETIPSTISLFNNFNSIFRSKLETEMITKKTMQMADMSFQNLIKLNEENNRKKFKVVKYSDFTKNPELTIHKLYREFQYKISDNYFNKLKFDCSLHAAFRSRHHYSLEEFNLTKEDIFRRYDFIYKKYYSLNTLMPINS